MWNRLRYSFWAPFYDSLASRVGFEEARRRSIDRLRLLEGDRVLIVGAGTGLDLEHLPAGVEATAVDVTPAMLRRLEGRAVRSGRRVATHVMDARQLSFPAASFDAVIMHLVLAVMPEPAQGLREALRVLRSGGRIAVFDKFLGERERVTLERRLLNIVAKPLFSDMNRRLGEILGDAPVEIERDEGAAFGGMYRTVTLRKTRS